MNYNFAKPGVVNVLPSSSYFLNATTRKEEVIFLVFPFAENSRFIHAYNSSDRRAKIDHRSIEGTKVNRGHSIFYPHPSPPHPPL